MTDKQRKELEDEGFEVGSLWFIIGVIGGFIWFIYSIWTDGFWAKVFSSEWFIWLVKIAGCAIAIIVIGIALYKTGVYIIKKAIYKYAPQPQQIPIQQPIQEVEPEEEGEKPLVLITDQVELIYFRKNPVDVFTEEQIDDIQNTINYRAMCIMKNYANDDPNIEFIHMDKYDDGILATIQYSRNINVNVAGDMPSDIIRNL